MEQAIPEQVLTLQRQYREKPPAVQKIVQENNAKNTIEMIQKDVLRIKLESENIKANHGNTRLEKMPNPRENKVYSLTIESEISISYGKENVKRTEREIISLDRDFQPITCIRLIDGNIDHPPITPEIREKVTLTILEIIENP